MVSGHATAGFAVAVSTGVVATMRGRKSAPWLWLAGLALATFNSYLRIAADRHYLTDVLAGAALGTLAGLAVPLVFHGVKAPVTVTPYASQGGGGVSIGGSW
jgi:membrane-associated phospholipid phosphatase